MSIHGGPSTGVQSVNRATVEGGVPAPQSEGLAVGLHLASHQLCALEPGPCPLCASGASCIKWGNNTKYQEITVRNMLFKSQKQGTLSVVWLGPFSKEPVA